MGTQSHDLRSSANSPVALPRSAIRSTRGIGVDEFAGGTVNPSCGKRDRDDVLAHLTVHTDRFGARPRGTSTR